MKLQVLSDLHLEFADFELDTSAADVVVLAGDVHVGTRGIQWILKNIPDKPVIYVLGNHEYYGKTYPKLLSKLKEAAAGSNIQLLENDTAEIDGVTFLGCTLWTDFALHGDRRMAGYECQQRMNDYKKIRRLPNYSKVRAQDIAAIHGQSLAWLDKSLAEVHGRRVVVTHHAPSAKSLPADFHAELISAAYASNLDDLVRQSAPALWVHGHIHSSSDYIIGSCRVVCNPKGYPVEPNPDFDAAKIITV